MAKINKGMEEMSEDNKSIKFIDKTYLTAYAIGIISALTAYFTEGIAVAISIVVGLAFFAFSVTNDAIETAKPLFKYHAVKGLAVITASIATTFALIQTYQDINNIIGIDPSLLAFTSSLIFIIKLASLAAFYIGLTFFVFILIASTFLPLLLIPLGIKKDKDKTKSNWVKFRWASRVIALFAVYFLGSVLAPERPEMKFMNNSLIFKLAMYADFNSRHHCTNIELINKPVIFLQKGFVLTTGENDFEIKKCY